MNFISVRTKCTLPSLYNLWYSATENTSDNQEQFLTIYDETKNTERKPIWVVEKRLIMVL